MIDNVSGTFFSRRRPWGGLKCLTVVELTFFKNGFSFVHHFKHPLFRAANLWKMSSRLCVVPLLETRCRFLAPSWGGVLRSPMCILYCKSNGFCIISLNIIKNLLVFHTFRPWLASGGGLFWISLVASLVLEALWGPFWVHLCPVWSAFTAFRHPMGSYFLNFKHNSDLT